MISVTSYLSLIYQKLFLHLCTLFFCHSTNQLLTPLNTVWQVLSYNKVKYWLVPSIDWCADTQVQSTNLFITNSRSL